MFESFSTHALEMIEKSLKIAKSLDKKIVGTEHLLLAMYQSKDSICRFLLEEKNIKFNKILDVINNLVILRKNENNDETYSKKFQEVIVFAKDFAKDVGSEYVNDEHIFYVLLKEYDSVANVVLEKLGLDIEDLIIDVEDIFQFFDEDTEKIPYSFLINLSSANKVHPFVERNNYIEKIQYILSKKQKNNPLLIGNAGVGKTAIVEGLSEIITECPIYQLDLGSIVSGTKYRGELEEKLTKAMEYIKKKEAILFIDEIHNIVGAGSNDGSLDIANILKPYLSRSDLKLIGATTLDEYYKYINKDKALSRRFQNVFIDEPNEQETYQIIKEIKSSYEEYHNIKYPDNILKEIINKSKMYLPTKNFPDKAIDVMDEIGARKNSSKKSLKKLLNEVIFEQSGLKEVTIQQIKNIKLNYPELKYKYIQFINKSEFSSINNHIAKITVDKDFEINYLISDLEQLFNFKKEMYLEIDLENYNDRITINNLIGSTAGYVGYDKGGILSEHIIKYPISLVFLKNFKLADKSIQSFFKSLFNKPSFIDNKGRTIYLTNVIFVVDSSINKLSTIGFVENPSIIKNTNIHLTTIKNKYNYKKLINLLNEHNYKLNNLTQMIENLTPKKVGQIISKLLLEAEGEYLYDFEEDKVKRKIYL